MVHSNRAHLKEVGGVFINPGFYIKLKDNGGHGHQELFRTCRHVVNGKAHLDWSIEDWIDDACVYRQQADSFK